MSRFFVERPIVAIVISILMVLLGLVAMVQLPVALYPNIAPPEILVQATYVGADALTIEEAVATPIEAQMTGVDNMLYMYSTSTTSGGQMSLRVAFDVSTDPSTDEVLAQMRYSQAASQLPPQVTTQGVTVKKSTSSPLAIFALYSPKGTYDPLFISNYAYVNINDPMTRVPGIGQVQISGAGQYAMRFWVRPDTLAKLEITVNDIINAIQAQNTVNASGQIGGNPVPSGQQFTYTVRAPGRLTAPADFENIVVRARPDGSIVRVKDVARVELGAQTYNANGRLDGRPATVIAVYQLPGSNALATVGRAKALMEQMKARFPADLDYVVSLDTTLAVTAGIHEIVVTLFQALALVILVVFIFLQGFRATLIPLLAVPVSLIGTFAVFPLLGFSINTLSLFGLVLAIGLVVDDAIVVVEAVEHHIEQGLPPREATLKAMEEVSGPVVAIALILVAVFVPTAFIPGITGRMYQQFAVTIAVSVIISAFNALTLSPALARHAAAAAPSPCAGRWAPSSGASTGGSAAPPTATSERPPPSSARPALSMLFLAGIAVAGRPRSARGCPPASSPRRTRATCRSTSSSPPRPRRSAPRPSATRSTPSSKDTPGVRNFTVVIGDTTTNTAQYFLTLDDWDRAGSQGPHRRRHHPVAQPAPRRAPRRAGVRRARPPPSPASARRAASASCSRTAPARTSSSSPATRRRSSRRRASGRSSARVNTTLNPGVPQFFADVDQDKVLKQGVSLSAVYQTLTGLSRRVLRRLLQPLRARLAGVRAGGGRVPHPRQRRRPVLRAEHRRATRCRCPRW